MKRKLIKILSIIFICIVVVFVIYKIDSINQTKERILNRTKDLMDSIKNVDYDRIRWYVSKDDDTELSNQEITNFLLNTGLYRVTLIDNEEASFTYSIDVDFFNTNKGTVLFSYRTLDGDLITNEMKYINTGIDEFFFIDNVEEYDKEIKRYPFAKDLANREEISYNQEDDESEIDKIWIYRVIQDESGDFYLEVVEEAKEDIKISTFNMLIEFFKDEDNKYKYEWNDDCSNVSVYYNSGEGLSSIKKLSIYSGFLKCSTTIQPLNENPDWHLTINYYDYNTEDLLKTEKVR